MYIAGKKVGRYGKSKIQFLVESDQTKIQIIVVKVRGRLLL